MFMPVKGTYVLCINLLSFDIIHSSIELNLGFVLATVKFYYSMYVQRKIQVLEEKTNAGCN